MKIYGLQKLTLLDYPEKIACTVFCGGCNYRCPFCHNAQLVLEPGALEGAMDEETFFAFLDKRKGVLDGVCVTGGEPLLQRDILPFLKSVKDRGFAVKLDTNGSFPEKLKEILQAGAIDYIAMDIKNSKRRYAETVGIPGFDTASVEQSVELIMSSGVDYEFRTTAVRELHTVADFEEIGQWIAGARRYFIQHFKDSGGLLQSGLSAMPEQEEDRVAKVMSRYVLSAAVRGR